MKTIQYPVSYLVEETTAARWAKISFCIYLFFMVFGTMMPFQASLQERAAQGEIGSSNILNQLLSLLFVVSFLSLWGKQQQIFDFVRKEKFLTLFLLWALLSVFWSNYSVVSLKRWITLFGEVVICLAAMLHVRWSEVALRYFRLILSIYLPLTILSVIFIPEAIQWEFPAWRGLAITKNNLGQVALFSIIIWFAIIPYNRKKVVNIFHYLMLAFAIAAYLGARSTTSFLVGAFLLMIAGILYMARTSNMGVIARFYAITLVSSLICIAVIIMIWAPEIIASFLGLFGKDLTFTGRVELWQAVLRMTQEKLWMGWGLGGFWVMSGEHLIPMFQQFVWIPNQAHQGYIDILNQTGLVGLLLLLAMGVSYVANLSSLKKKNVWKWLFIGVLILNIQESVFFRPRHLGHFVFVFAYVAFYCDLIKEKQAQVSQQIIAITR